ncbi:hypothetical protein H711_00415, partial [Brucella ovis IntaBari-2009-88-3]
MELISTRAFRHIQKQNTLRPFGIWQKTSILASRNLDGGTTPPSVSLLKLKIFCPYQTT